MSNVRNKFIVYAWGVIGLLAICLLSPATATAGTLKCHGSTPVERVVSCTTPQIDFDAVSSAFRWDTLGPNCGVCRSSSSTYFDPKIDIAAREPFRLWPDTYIWSRTFTLRPTECAWGSIYRFCARLAKPGEDIHNEGYGNETYYTDNPRVQLCGYHDPLDGMDTDSDFAPFHFRTPNEQAPSVEEGAVGGAVAGAAVGAMLSFVIPGLGFLMGIIIGAALGAAIGALVAAIMSTFNHFVYGNLGCVDVPIAPGPPAFTDDRWFAKYLVKPDIKIGDNSNFTDIYLELYTCELVSSNGDIYQKNTECFDSDGEPISGTKFVGSAPTIAHISAPYYRQDNVRLPDGRKYSIRIDDTDPMNVCLYKTALEDASPWKIPDSPSEDERNGMNEEVLEICVKRPNTMPMPVISEAEGSSHNSPKVMVTFAGESSTITFSLNGNNNCAKLGKVDLCLEKACRTWGGGENNLQCQQARETVCVSGYESPYEVAFNMSNRTIIEGAPNTQINGTWVYNPPFCYEVSSSGPCLNRSGNCEQYNEDGTQCVDYVDEITNDQYYINNTTVS